MLFGRSSAIRVQQALAVVLSLLVVGSLFAAPVAGDSSEAIENGTADRSYSLTTVEKPDGNGTADDPYNITTVEELQWIDNDLDAYYILGKDIDASETVSWNDGRGFDPIAGETLRSAFSGTLDGQGHTINGLFIDRGIEVALFAATAPGATIRSVHLTNVNITGEEFTGGLVASHIVRATVSNSSVNGNISGGVWVGGLVGRNIGGTIERSSASGHIAGGSLVGGVVGSNTDGTVKRSSASGHIEGGYIVGGLVGINGGGTVRNSSVSDDLTVTGHNSVIGGLIGDNHGGSVINSSASNNVLTNASKVGGLIGVNQGAVTVPRPVEAPREFSYPEATVRDSWASGNVTGHDMVGGLIGSNLRNGTVTESYATGNVSGTENVGGLIGRNRNTTFMELELDRFPATGVPEAVVSESYATGNVSGTQNVGGLVGVNNNSTVRESFATGEITGNESVGGLVGRESNARVMDSYWDTQTTTQSTSAGGTGLTTAEMTGTAALTNMPEFDFSNTWVLTDSYPRLGWSLESLSLTLANGTIPLDGQTQATVTATFRDGSAETATTVADYDSNNESVATVTDDGVVRGVGPGDATLTATLSSLSDTATIVVTLRIDVKPDSDRNKIPPSKQATVPVAIIGTEGFDPTTEVVNSSLRFGEEETVKEGNGSAPLATDVDDVNDDGIEDLIVVFRVADTGFEPDDTVARLEGTTIDGRDIFGEDTVTVLNKGRD